MRQIPILPPYHPYPCQDASYSIFRSHTPITSYFSFSLCSFTCFLMFLMCACISSSSLLSLFLLSSSSILISSLARLFISSWCLSSLSAAMWAWSLSLRLFRTSSCLICIFMRGSSLCDREGTSESFILVSRKPLNTNWTSSVT